MAGFRSQILVTERLLDEITLNNRIYTTAELSTIISNSVLDSSSKMIDGFNSIDRPFIHTFWEIPEYDKQWIDINDDPNIDFDHYITIIMQFHILMQWPIGS